MRRSVADFCASGRPVLAECGGLLYLTESLRDLQGGTHPMCGVLPARAAMAGRLRALGYRTARPREDSFLAPRGQELRGHEFHYGTLDGTPAGPWRDAFDWEGSRGALGTEGWWNGAVLATWFHGWLAGEATIGCWIEAMRAVRAKEEAWN
jgi:cobyrinic acid a,c-diamide synthase